MAVLARGRPDRTACRDALGFVPVVEEEFYVAFGGEGVSLAILSRPGMGANAHDHADYRTRSRVRRSS